MLVTGGKKKFKKHTRTIAGKPNQILLINIMKEKG